MTKSNREFGIFILSHGRASNIKTIQALNNANYTGKVYIIVDDTDKQIEEYKSMHDNVIVFDKKKAYEETDTMDNSGDMRVVVFARNKCHEIAKDLGLTHFLVLDDDYVTFSYRRNFNGLLRGWKVRDLDQVIEYTLDYLDESNATSLAWSQGGDLIGGANGMISKPYKRKVMNTFFCRTDRPFYFKGTINEDTTTYTLLGSQGHLFLTITDITVNQTDTQTNAGGLTDIYLDLGTYVKSFYTVMAMPSATAIRLMGNKHKRPHHSINWKKATPKIIKERYKKWS